MKTPKNLWNLAARAVTTDQAAVLVAVVDHRGSVPGKTGALMVVTPDQLEGTVGGGLVEHQLIDLSRSGPEIQLLPFAHDGESSDSICSGHQTMAVIPLTRAHLEQLEILAEVETRGAQGNLILSPEGPTFDIQPARDVNFSNEEGHWRFVMPIGPQDTITIVGGGHVGLALSRVMATLPFRIVVVDDRSDLPTLIQNHWAHTKQQVKWPEIAHSVVEGDRSWVVIMTRGHRHDSEVLRKLMPLKLRYLGMMGSETKVRQVYSKLESEGFSATDLKRVHAPIGIPIASHTPEEIAISIAAEIIKTRNTKANEPPRLQGRKGNAKKN